MSELKCACSAPEYCGFKEGDKLFLYNIDGRLMNAKEKAEYEKENKKDYNALDAEVQRSGFIRKPAANEFYIVFEEPLTELERLTVGAVVFNALAVAFPKSHIGDYKGLI